MSEEEEEQQKHILEQEPGKKQKIQRIGQENQGDEDCR